MSHGSSPRTIVRPLLLVLVLAAGLGLALKFRGEPSWPDEVAPGMKAESKVRREDGGVKIMAAPAEAEAQMAGLPVAELIPTTPPAVEPGHEGHGDECAHCAGEKRLAACREDYAQLCYTQMLREYDVAESKSRALLEACRTFSASVLKEWSHSESRPVLPADEIVESRRREIVGPLLTGLPARQD